MAFIREKLIKGRPYAYLVENEWRDGSSRQSVKAYLGRIHRAPENHAPDLEYSDDIIQRLLAAELEGFDKQVRVGLNDRTVEIEGKQQVIGLNGGHLCTHTLKELFAALHVRNEERPGTALAEAFSRAGLRIPRIAFIELYKRYHA